MCLLRAGAQNLQVVGRVPAPPCLTLDSAAIEESADGVTDEKVNHLKEQMFFSGEGGGQTRDETERVEFRILCVDTNTNTSVKETSEADGASRANTGATPTVTPAGVTGIEGGMLFINPAVN
ncbi:unnamed protein product [Pleuronectes platessa]|uniref:Uncharacterized protein n=1 Tax=Pleuronectes platessa TaxID=8262 RepID=A0A9N7UFT1_PLEPL|nr:unnamed protein product [Pleuronectes platessa]